LKPDLKRTKREGAPKGKYQALWRLHMIIFWQTHLLILLSRRLRVRLMSLLGDAEQLPQKYSYPHGLSRGKLPVKIASFFKPNLMIANRNVAFSGETLKPRLQEGRVNLKF
jgi:hypothetical protein